MFWDSKKVIGIDIGSSSIKMAELDVGSRGASLLSFGFAPTPANSISDGSISDVGAVAAAIRNLYEDIKPGRKNAAVGLWGLAVIVKKITTGKITDPKLLREQAQHEAVQYIPFDPSTISIDYHVLKSSTSPETMDMLLVAAQNELINQYFQTLDMAGLK
ncbi:MAG: pilus assembly protein PilM, partial [Bdellovibrionaceae bacterium]|nr:pilus assembly protein PilM [Pseudobdellovibrionaceae bacterium]